ncbi:hypothetical protein R3P38DRAFT_2758746 [Favolaschia claudopus]|uniref:Uncharacterized protein n=1 Tax=Favolaschia claudopus TaxID=2862362 RepID=A0AAW0E2X1_9AGAR
MAPVLRGLLSRDHTTPSRWVTTADETRTRLTGPASAQSAGSLISILGSLVLLGERVYNISEEEDPPPPYKGREILPPYVEVAAPKNQDICSSLGTSKEPAQQRGREAGERISPPMCDVAAPASSRSRR